MYFFQAFRSQLLYTWCNNKIFGSKEKAKKFIDTLFVLLEIVNGDENNNDLTFRMPRNLLIQLNHDRMTLYLGSKNVSIASALFTNNVISDRPVDSVMIDDFRDGLGSECEFYFNVPYEFYYKYSSAFEYRMKDDLTETFRDKRELLKNNDELYNYIKRFLKQILEQYLMGGIMMHVEPRFKARDIVVNPNQCFYVMDFHNKKVQEAYEALATNLMEKLNIRVIKSGDIFDPNRKNEMVENIWQDIVGSRLVIADISCKNPNVFYELGICDTVGKKVIPICNKQSFDDDYQGQFPFDVQQEFTTIYESTYTGVNSMVKKIVKMVDAIINNKPTLVE